MQSYHFVAFFGGAHCISCLIFSETILVWQRFCMVWESLLLISGPNSLSSTVSANNSDASSWNVNTCTICCCCCGCSSFSLVRTCTTCCYCCGYSALSLVTTLFDVCNGSSNGGSTYSLSLTFTFNLSSSSLTWSISVSSEDENVCLFFLALPLVLLLALSLPLIFLLVLSLGLLPSFMSLDSLVLVLLFLASLLLLIWKCAYPFSGLQIECSAHPLNQGLETLEILFMCPLRNLQEVRNFFVAVVVAIILIDVDLLHCLLSYFLNSCFVYILKYLRLINIFLQKKSFITEKHVLCLLWQPFFQNDSRKDFPKCSCALHNFLF